MYFKTVICLAVIAATLPHESTSTITLSERLKGIFVFPGTKRDIIIEMEPVLGQVIQHHSLASLGGDEKKNQIISLLKEHTMFTQQPVLNALGKLGMLNRAKPFWIANRIFVKDVDLAGIQAISKVPGLTFAIREPVKAKIYPVTETEDAISSNRGNEAMKPYGVEKINADKVWKTGNEGQGVVVGIIDTGVNWNHVALMESYKNDSSSWYDAFEKHTTPHDGNGHGTHCTGTICGTTNGIGVAPKAKWIACRGLDDEGSGDEKTLLSCGEFMACPSGNATGNCSGFPQIISNSWGGLIGAQDFYNPVISVWRLLNIIPFFALGNSGPLCMTSGSPGDQDNVISVGATDAHDKLASFSSRGPALISGKLKPEISAPGKDIVSATHDSNDGYRKLSGTSMACPHSAGAAALLLAANPNADFNTVLKVLESTAYKRKLGFSDTANVCSFPVKYPNNGYGSGRINVEDAAVAIKTM